MSRKKSRSDVDYLFVPAPHALVTDARVSHPAYRLWCLLHILAWQRESPDPERLQELMDAGERSIYRWLKELEAAGWIEWNRNRYDLRHRFLLKAGGSGEAATLAQVRAALNGAASIEEIRRIVESADTTQETPPGDGETFVTSGKSDPVGKTDPSGKSDPTIKSTATTISTSATSGKSRPDSSLSNGMNRPPSEDQKIQNHDDDDEGAPATFDFARKLAERGIFPATIREIAQMGHDPLTVLQSLDNMLDDGRDVQEDPEQTRRFFVIRLRVTPPEKGKPYERRLTRPVQPDTAPPRAGHRARVTAHTGNTERDAEYQRLLAEAQRRASGD
jgi:hypothetical protein